MNDDERNERYRRLMRKIDYIMMNSKNQTGNGLFSPKGNVSTASAAYMDVGKAMRYRNSTDPAEQEEMKWMLKHSGLPVELLEKMVESDINMENGNVLDAPNRENIELTLVSDTDKVGFIFILDDTEICRFSTEKVTCDVSEGVYVMRIVTDDAKRKVIHQGMAMLDVSLFGRNLGIRVKKSLFGYKAVAET